MKMRKTAGLTMITVLMILAVLVPTVILTAYRINQSIRSSHTISGRQTSLQYALNAVKDYMHQLTINVYAPLKPNELVRPLINKLENGNYKVTHNYDDVTKTLQLNIIGAAGTDSANPTAQQRITALIKFISFPAEYASNFNFIDKLYIDRDNVTLDGGFWAFNLHVNGANVKFTNGPVVVEKNMNTNGAKSPYASPFINGDLWVGGTLNLKPELNTITGQIHNMVPVMPDFYIDIEALEEAATHVFNGHVALKFYPDGTFRYTNSAMHASNNLNYFLDKNSKYDKAKESQVVWSAPVNIAANGIIILVKDGNVGIAGEVQGKVSVVVTGNSSSANEGNGIFYDDLVYAGPSLYSSPTNSFALYALNQILIKDSDWYTKKQSDSVSQNMKISGILYQAFGRKSNKAGCDPSMDHMFINGPSNAGLTFTGTINALPFFQNSYNNYFQHNRDSNLPQNAPPGPAYPKLTNLTIK